jgi:oligoendopeptidase F
MSNATTVTRPPRASIPTEQTWDLEGLYPDQAAWEADLARIDALLAELAPFRGRLGEGPATLLACLRLHDRLSQVARHVNWYATNRLSEDQADPARQALQDRATAMVARVNAATAFLEPELLALPPGTIESLPYRAIQTQRVRYILH